MAASNVELKARDRDPGGSAERCVALGASDEGMLVQKDTYFGARNGRLKLREQGADGSFLIAYRRLDRAESELSDYTLAPVSDPAPLAEALEAALGIVVVVSKRRRLFLWQGVRIHLDEVEGLGSFIELEAVLPDAGDLDEAEAKVAHLRAQLEIAVGDLVEVGYADLLMDGPQELLVAADRAMRNAYVPYSNFPVGAAVRAQSGAIYAGANVENVAFPVGWCAEASALGALISAGETAITAVAVVSEKLEYCPPCGGCRQRLAEFGAVDTPVYLGRPGGEIQRATLGELLPGS
ncbi:MAG TPA: cytidine deaminase, partial [Solirubrobacteraceae bacterium]|nr:cytidine deaminase [Solirubrobacteraceae bacterium]